MPAVKIAVQAPDGDFLNVITRKLIKKMYVDQHFAFVMNNVVNKCDFWKFTSLC